MNIDKHKYIDKQLKEYIETILAKSDCDFDENKFNQWLIKNDVEHKTNPSAYIKACFKRELEQGTFKPINETEILAKIMPHLYKHLNRNLEKFGIKQWEGFGDETFFVESLQLYIYEHQILTIEELIKLNDMVMGYITSLEKPKITDYRSYIKKAKAIKDEVDWAMIDEIEAKERKEFDELMKVFDERDKRIFDPTFSIEDIENMNKLDVNESEPSL